MTCEVDHSWLQDVVAWCGCIGAALVLLGCVGLLVGFCRAINRRGPR